MYILLLLTIDIPINTYIYINMGLTHLTSIFVLQNKVDRNKVIVFFRDQPPVFIVIIVS